MSRAPIAHFPEPLGKRVRRWWRRRQTGIDDRHPTAGELAVLHRIVEGGDWRHQRLVKQLEQIPELERTFDGPTFAVRPAYAFDAITFPLEVTRVESEWVRVRDSRSGRLLEFSVAVVRSGFLDGLRGRTVDGAAWPMDWEPDLSGLTPTDGPLLRLPDLKEQQRLIEAGRLRLGEWLGVKLPRKVRLTPRASDAAIASRQAELGGTFPPSYVRFLQMTDGLEYGNVRIHGHADAYVVDHPSQPGLLIQWDGDDRDDFVVLLALDGLDETVYRVDIHDRSEAWQTVAPDIAAFLRGLLKGTHRVTFPNAA